MAVRRRYKQNNTSYPSSQFSSNFALFGCLGSIIAICILAIVCQIIDYNTNSEYTAEKIYASEDLHIHRRLEQVNKLLLDRRLEQSDEQFGSGDSISTVDESTHRRLEQVDEFGISDNNSMPCGDIFLNVKKNTTNNTTDTSYQQRLCNYAKNCHGDYPLEHFYLSYSVTILIRTIHPYNTNYKQYTYTYFYHQCYYYIYYYYSDCWQLLLIVTSRRHWKVFHLS